MVKRHKNRIGEKLGLLKVLRFCYSDGGRSFWEVLCDCGSKKIIRLDNKPKSCGCLRRKINKIRNLGKGSYKTKEKLIELSARDIYRRNYADGDISFKLFLKLTSNNCYYCGQEPKNRYSIAFDREGNPKKSKRKDSEGKYYDQLHWSLSNYEEEPAYFIYNGLDRLNQSKKHDKDNVVPCCWTCNKMKINYSKDEFLQHIKRIWNWTNNIQI